VEVIVPSAPLDFAARLHKRAGISSISLGDFLVLSFLL
jgi:hypothetical protein